MEYLLKIADYNWKPGSQTEMIYEDVKGEYFIGPPKNIFIGNTYTVEIGDKPIEEKYYRIIKFIA